MQIYPAAMQYFDKGSANILSVLWFLMLSLLGIDSLFAMVEGVCFLHLAVYTLGWLNHRLLLAA
jgi:hypothetical protein